MILIRIKHGANKDIKSLVLLECLKIEIHQVKKSIPALRITQN